jgi:hypothetical protein
MLKKNVTHVWKKIKNVSEYDANYFSREKLINIENISIVSSTKKKEVHSAFTKRFISFNPPPFFTLVNPFSIKIFFAVVDLFPERQ